MEGLYLIKWGQNKFCHIQCGTSPLVVYPGVFHISKPDVYSRYNEIGVYMEGLYLRKLGKKHILLNAVGYLALSSVL
jgi:hypothetical protein